MLATVEMNPWLSIPASDYEAHMSDLGVMQMQMLNNCLQQIIAEKKPASALVLGSATGNGFEHFLNSETQFVKAIDINPEYCEILKKRFSEKILGLDVECIDLNEVQLLDGFYDLVHCALVFEYVDIPNLLKKIKGVVKTDGWMSVVLQQPSIKTSPVTQTSYKSLEKLSGFMHLISSDEFVKMASEAGFHLIKKQEMLLPTGKSFFIGIFNI